MASRLYYERMIRLSTNGTTRATQLAADPTLTMYCRHSLSRQYLARFGGTLPVPVPGEATTGSAPDQPAA